MLLKELPVLLDVPVAKYLSLYHGLRVPFHSQVEQGADLLDINMDDGLIEGIGAMTRFVNLLVADPETSRVPFMIDSSKVLSNSCKPLFFSPSSRLRPV